MKFIVMKFALLGRWLSAYLGKDFCLSDTKLLKFTEEFFPGPILSTFWQKGSSHIYIQKPFHYKKHIHLSIQFQNFSNGIMVPHALGSVIYFMF